MNIQASSYQAQMLTSLKQALNVSMLQKAMKQDAQSVESVVKAMEQSVTPHLGQNIDIKL
ncbi:MAG: YjfB family protein [Firmicutes bacterium]|nr:YjfB family protein [Bacillota bacterium]